MRIISGNLKGKKINFIKSSTTRPLRDAVKENIFNILCHSSKIKVNIENSNVLDLYSGAGSFGLECISRGAKNVTFIEKDKNAIHKLQVNLRNYLISDKAQVFCNKIENIVQNRLSKQYNIFFLDPPYSDNMFINNLKLIKLNKIYDETHVVILHREKSMKNEDFLNTLNVFEVKNYGRSKIIFGTFI